MPWNVDAKPTKKLKSIVREVVIKAATELPHITTRVLLIFVRSN